MAKIVESKTFLGLDRPSEREPEVTERRSRIAGLLVSIVFLVIVGRLVDLQLFRGKEFRVRSLDNLIQFRRIDHLRGDILDRFGRTLVSHRPSVNVYLTPAFLPDAWGTIFQLARVVGVSRDEAQVVSKALSKAVQEEGPPFLLARDVTHVEAERLRDLQRSMELPNESLVVIPMEADDRLAVFIDPRTFPSVGRVIDRLAEMFDWDEAQTAEWNRKIRTIRGLERYVKVLVERDISASSEARLSLETQLGELPGVSVERSNTRHYPNGAVAAHLLGYVNEISAAELQSRRELGYRSGDTIGRWGVEQAFEEELRGVDGQDVDIVDSKGRVVRTQFAQELKDEIGGKVRPIPGDRLVLSIDLDMQKAAEAAFDGKAGAVVLMEVDTGRLLALTSTPSFNPERVSGRLDASERKRLADLQPFRPWRFRAIQDHFSPGSTFKVITALAALREKKVRETESIFCPGSYTLGRTKFRCWKDEGHGFVDLRNALAKSCDVYFYTLGARMALGPILETAQEWGFGSKTGIDLPDESAGILPTERWCRANRSSGCSLGDAVNASIGQGAVSVTPIQLAVAFAGLSEYRSVLVPQLALRVESRTGKDVRQIEPKVRHRVQVPDASLKAIRDGLHDVMNVPYGTAYYRRSKIFEVSGKTGTAQVKKLGKVRVKTEDLEWKDRDHAWFAALAPSESPRVVVVVFMEHGGGGSRSAAPVAISLLEAWYKKYGPSSSPPAVVEERKTEVQ
jgi:penicillin-binding protein 2